MEMIAKSRLVVGFEFNLDQRFGFWATVGQDDRSVGTVNSAGKFKITAVDGDNLKVEVNHGGIPCKGTIPIAFVMEHYEEEL